MKNYNKIINDKNIFKLFFNKVPYARRDLDRVLVSDSAHRPTCLYKESVRVLQAAEQFVLDLKYGTLPQFSNLGIDTLGHAEFNNLFIVYFDQLKFYRDMFDMDYLQLSLNWSYYQKFLAEDAEGLSDPNVLIKKIPRNSPGPLPWRQQWSSTGFNEQKARRFINYFMQLHQNPEYIAAVKEQTTKVVASIDRAFSYFDELLSIHQSVYIFIVDVHLVRMVDHVRYEPFGQFIEQVLRDRSMIQNMILQEIPGWLHAYTKLEHDYKNGLKLSCILVLRENSVDQEEALIARLESLLKNAFQQYDDVTVVNGNEFIRVHASKQAVDLIGVKTKKRIESFKYWVLSYFFRIDDFARLIHPQCSFEINQSIQSPDWQQPDLQHSLQNVKKAPQVKNLVQILDELKLPNSIWRLEHLSKRIADRLLISHIYYTEFCAEQGLPPQGADMLFQLEVFIETMLHNRYIAFNDGNSVDEQGCFSTKDLRVLSSQLGLQYLSIVKQVTGSPHLFEQIGSLIHQGSLHTWWFRREDRMLWLHVQQIFRELPLTQPIDRFILSEFNQRIQNARHSLFTKERLQSETRLNLDKHYTQCIKRHMQSETYLHLVMQQNCWAYRIVVDARSPEGSFTQSQLSKLFTEFMRLAKRAKPCYWLRGYVGIWQENSWQVVVPEFKLDVVLFFNDRCQEQVETVVRDLDQRWNDFLNAKAAQILKRQDPENIKYYGAIKPKKLMHSIDALNTEREAPNTYHVCLEAYDRQMKKMVIEQVIPYFAYRDVFQAPLSQKVPKAFIKGSMLKK